MARVSHWLCLRWATNDEIDHSANQSVSGADVIKSEEWFVVVPFSSVISDNPIVSLSYFLFFSRHSFHGHSINFMFIDYISLEYSACSMSISVAT